MPCDRIFIAISTLLVLTFVILPTCGRKNHRNNGPHRNSGDFHPINPILSSPPEASSSFSIGDPPRDDNSMALAFAAEPASQFVAFNNRKVTFRCSPKLKQARVSWLFNSNPLNESFFSPYLKISKSTRLNIQLPKLDATASDESGQSQPRSSLYDIRISDSPHAEVSLHKIARDIMDKLNGTIQCLITSPFSNESLLSNPVKIFIATLESFPSPSTESSSPDSPPINITQNVTYIEDNTAVITCNLPHSVPSAVAEFIFTPSTGGSSAVNTIVIDKYTNTSKYLIMPSGNLQILSVKNNDSGIYECVAHNPYIDERKKSPVLINLKVKKKPSARLSHPKFTSHPNPVVSAISGTNLTLECSASSPSPGPRITWSKINGSLPESRIQQVAGNLIINFVNRADEGIYVCRAEAASPDTKFPEVLEARSSVTIHETVSVSITKNIIKSSGQFAHADSVSAPHMGPGAIITCSARGNPRPNIHWVYNGHVLSDAHDSGIYSFDDTSVDSADTSRVYIQKDKISSGLLQCFATNELGTVYESIKAWDSNDDATNKNSEHFSFSTFIDEPIRSSGVHSSNRDTLDIGSLANPHQPGGTDEEVPEVDGVLPNVPSTGRNRPNGGRSRARPNKHDSNSAKPVPTRPIVNRLSDDSVIVRWSIPDGSDKTQIDFFKVQYKDTDSDGSLQWKTADDEISPNMHSYIINGLNPGSNYKFRVLVAFKNHDNAASSVSPKFTLVKNPSMTRPRAAPIITSVVPLSPSALEVTWQYEDLHMVQNSIDGFFIHWRETTSMAAYFTDHIQGAGTRSHILTHLLPATAYEVKIQAHNSAGPSADSNIVSNSTLAKGDSPGPTVLTPSTESPPRSPTPGPAHDTFVVYLLLGIIVFITVLVIITFFTLCVVKQKNLNNTVSGNTSNSSLSIDSAHRHRPMGTGRSIDPHSLRGSPVGSLRRDKLKYGKERHPKAHSLHNLHHSMSKLDYGNPYGNYVKTATINKTAINGTLTKSMNGLAFHAESTNHSAFVYRDARDSSDTEMSDKISEIRITVNPPYETESVQVDIGDRRNGLLTTATTTTTTSALSRGRNSPRVHGRNSTFRSLNRNASFKSHMASGHTLTHRHQHTHQYAMQQHHTLDHRYSGHRSGDPDRMNTSNINFKNAHDLNAKSTTEGISPRSDFSKKSSRSATTNYDRFNRNQLGTEKAASIISSISTNKSNNNHITNTNGSRPQYLASYGESPLSSASEPGSSASSTSANVTSGGASSDNCCEGDSGTPLLMNRCFTTHNSSNNGPLVIMQSSC